MRQVPWTQKGSSLLLHYLPPRPESTTPPGRLDATALDAAHAMGTADQKEKDHDDYLGRLKETGCGH